MLMSPAERSTEPTAQICTCYPRVAFARGRETDIFRSAATGEPGLGIATPPAASAIFSPSSVVMSA